MLLFMLLFVEFKALLFINYTFNYEVGTLVMKLNVKLKSISVKRIISLSNLLISV